MKISKVLLSLWAVMVSVYMQAQDPCFVQQYDSLSERYGLWNTCTASWEVFPNYSSITVYSDALYRVERDGRRYYINKNNEAVVDYPFLDSKAPHPDCIIAKTAKGWGMLNNNGDTLMPFTYEDLGFSAPTNFDFTLGLIPFQQDGKLGLYRFAKKGKVVAVPSYDAIYPFKDNKAVVKRKGRFGIINTKGKEILPLAFDSLAILDYNYYLIAGSAHYATSPWQKNIYQKAVGLLDKKGEWLASPVYKALQPINEEVAIAQMESGKTFLMNIEGGTSISQLYDGIELFNDTLVMVEQAGVYALMNYQGKRLTAFQYHSFTMDSTGVILHSFPSMYLWQDEYLAPRLVCADSVVRLWEGLDAVQRNGKWGWCSWDSSLIVQPQLDKVEALHDSLLIVNYKGRYGLFRPTEQALLYCQYDSLWAYQEGYLMAQKNGLLSLYAIETKQWVLENKQAIQRSSKGLAYQEDNRWALIEEQGYSFPPISEHPLVVNDHILWLVVEGEHLLFNLQDSCLFNYSTKAPINQRVLSDNKGKALRRSVLIESVGPMRFRVMTECGWKLADHHGYFLTDTSYDSILPYGEHLYKVKRGELYGFLNQYGAEVWPLFFEEIPAQLSENVLLWHDCDDWRLYQTETMEEMLSKLLRAQEVGRFTNGVARVKQFDKYGFLEEHGKVIVSTQYEKLKEPWGHYAAAYMNRHWGVINLYDGLVLQPVHDAITEGRNGYFVCKGRNKKESGFYLMDSTNQRLSSTFNDSLYFISDSLLMIVEGGKYGLMNLEGREIVFSSYSSIQEVHRDVFIGTYLGKTGLGDFNNTQIISFDYDGAYFTNGLIVLYLSPPKQQYLN